MEKKKVIEKIEKLVEKEFKSKNSKYGYDPFQFHIKPVVKIARSLARKLKADEEVVELAALMHDVGAIVAGRDNHHLTSAKWAKRQLGKLDYDEAKISRICDCIITHRGSQKLKPKSLEAQILIEADTINAFSDLAGLFQCALVYEKLSRGAAKKSVLAKLKNKWRQLKFKDSKKQLSKRYEAALLLLDN